MWARRVDLYICEPMGNGFRFGKGIRMFKDRIHTIPEAAEGLQASASDRLAWLDGQMEGRDWICGDRFTLADILLYANIECFIPLGQPLDPGAREHRGVARAGGRTPLGQGLSRVA